MNKNINRASALKGKNIMSKILISVSLCLAVVSANALDVSGIRLGSSLEDAKKIMLSLNKNYLKRKDYPLETYTMNGIPVGYRVSAVCEYNSSEYVCDQTSIFQGEHSNVWSAIRYQLFINPKDRFPVSELKSMLQKKYGLDSTGELNPSLKKHPYLESNNFMIWEFDKFGKQHFMPRTDAAAYDSICEVGFARTLEYYVNFQQNTPFPTEVNSTCGKYLVVYFREDENNFVEAFSVGMSNIGDLYELTMRTKQTAKDAKNREIDAQRGKGLKPNL